MTKSQHGKIFIKGLLFILPILLTVTILIWLVRSSESLLSQPLKAIIPYSFHFPGMGIFIALVIIYVVGLAIQGRVLRVIFQWLQDTLRSVPLVNVIYSNISEMIEFLSGGKDDELERVVLVETPGGGKLIGFVTQADSDVASSEGNSDNNQKNEKHSAVYLPMSYQMGGYLVYFPESKLETLNITKREAMQRVLTADIGGAREG